LALALGPVHAQAPPPQRSARPVPAPAFAPGTERKLADFSQVSSYFTTLAAASPRVRLFTIGKSTEGREMILAAISSEENLRRLDRFKDIARQLSDARGLNDAQARQLSREGKAIVWIDFGLHATEVGHAQVSSEVAYMVATEETPEMKRIRDEVIFVTVPVMNPDGLDIVANRVAGKPAALDVAIGRGHVVLTGFGVQFRGQPHGTFKLLFNPILESAVDGAGTTSAQGR